MPPADQAPPTSGPVLTDQEGPAGTSVRDRLALVRGRIDEAATRAGRPPHAVTLVAVSKNFGVEVIEQALAAGQVEFGEARAQELTAKAGRLGTRVRWHFVGRLQRNKVKDVLGVASLIHSVDRAELADAIAERARGQGRVQRVLVQVNVGDDPAKGGCAPEDVADLLSTVRELPGVACQGLMTIPPLGVDCRPLYRHLRGLRDEVRARYPEVTHLSMGMSADYEVAVQEGATIVRVGEAVFGPRPEEG